MCPLVVKTSSVFQIRRKTETQSVNVDWSRSVECLLPDPIPKQILVMKITWCMSKAHLLMLTSWAKSYGLYLISDLDLAVWNIANEEKSTPLQKWSWSPTENVPSMGSSQFVTNQSDGDTFFCHFEMLRSLVNLGKVQSKEGSPLPPPLQIPAFISVLSPWQQPTPGDILPMTELLLFPRTLTSESPSSKSQHLNHSWRQMLDFINMYSFIQHIILLLTRVLGLLNQ